MYDMRDTICALSSGGVDAPRHIIRLSGSECRTGIAELGIKKTAEQGVEKRDIFLSFNDRKLRFSSFVYSFPEGRSYTLERLIEIHVQAPLPAAEEIISVLTAVEGIRLAGPGEFTYRAFMNGRLSLAQSEAVSQIVSGSSRYHIQAAQKLMKGDLTIRLEQIKNSIVELLGLFEAGLDFSGEDIVFIQPEEAKERAEQIKKTLREIIENNLAYERMLGLASAAAAGLPNAGKSSLVNALLGCDRAIVSEQKATTRDILSSVCQLEYQDCILSDCAGMMAGSFADEIDQAAQELAGEYILSSDLILFCVESGKACYEDEKRVFDRIRQKNILGVATKCDLAGSKRQMEEIFGIRFVEFSIKQPEKLQILKTEIQSRLSELSPAGEQITAVNKRHRDSVFQCLEDLDKAAELFAQGDEELAALCLREGYSKIADIDQQKELDERVLSSIFQNFCIGK
ncbi:tRNA modification GTPase MnmE [Sedimentisphaera cyanobacteriorum]|uniref:tRNA modification GTPase MnmE n=1 Tax=Sedimentisphaera cyanobacteriorum TaxID=1940790 RepID=A0A1Q2HMR3_9BACT|nr:GTPase [Sedimentisphaera cyanobacteriorum]AQQ08718.1 tRNA modification GTPase MnmE [Sedimentisphaera cyanobacteriorum]